MSAIGGFNPTSHYLYLQSLNSSQLSAQNIAAANTRAAKAAQNSDGDADGSTSGASANRGSGSSFFQLIQSAVTSALQSAQSSGAAANSNQVVQSAIAQVLKNQPNVTTGSDPDGDGDIDAPGAPDNDNSTDQSSSINQTAFTQLLQSNGVNAQQFQQDFLTAVQSAQNGGSSDAAGVYSAFPPGSLIDTLA